MTKELIDRLMAAGLTKTQAKSVTAETVTNVLMSEDGKLLLREASQRVIEMQELVIALKRDYDKLKGEMEQVSKTILGVSEAQAEFGSVSSERAKEVLALYGALLTVTGKAGCSGETSAQNAGYILYAFLGGQAKREINTCSKEADAGNRRYGEWSVL